MKTILYLLFAFCAVLVLGATTLSADNSYGQYSTPSGKSGIVVDKFVGIPHSRKDGTVYTFVDNLGPRDFKFTPGALLFFKVRVSNVSGETLHNVTLTDTFPSYVMVYEDQGTFNKSNNTLTINVGTLAKDESKSYTLKAKVLGQEKLPTDKGLFCLINKVAATSDNGSDEDNAQFCIEKQVLGVKEVPKAGAEFGFAITGLSTLLGYAGLKLRKITG